MVEVNIHLNISLSSINNKRNAEPCGSVGSMITKDRLLQSRYYVSANVSIEQARVSNEQNAFPDFLFERKLFQGISSSLLLGDL